MQVSELTNIIESKQKSTQESKNQKIQTMLTWVGVALGVASLVSVFKDLKDLLGF